MPHFESQDGVSPALNQRCKIQGAVPAIQAVPSRRFKKNASTKEAEALAFILQR
jgi:hypothetical protein